MLLFQNNAESCWPTPCENYMTSVSVFLVALPYILV
uniref:Uncharacterized protein n=1 Tax=Anguilla anguilla TaxID=7936 RepID=A0A0E9PC57_ANGAN